MRLQLESLVLLIVTATLLNCGESRAPVHPQNLIGKYQLHFDSAGRPTFRDEITLSNDGEYVHTFDRPPDTRRASTGRWRIIRDKIVLSDWVDYAGVTSLQPTGERMVDYTASFEGTPPVIVLEADRNIYYRRDTGNTR